MSPRPATVLLAALVACTPGEQAARPTAPGKTESRIALSGSVAKGPFLLGSAVSVSVLDATGNPTGSVFQTQTTDDAGRFAVTVAAPAGTGVRLDAAGYYYNEVTAGLSTGPITLRGYQVAGADASVNLLTHLASRRVEVLLSGGPPLVDAVVQAEREVAAELHIGPPGVEPSVAGAALGLLAGDDDASAWLFGLGTVLVAAATGRAGEGVPIDAALSELVNLLGEDLADGHLAGDGALPDGDDLYALQATLDADATMALLAARFGQIGVTSPVPDLHRVFDHDLDGVVDRDDPDGDADGALKPDDCEDYDPTVFPGAPEDFTDGVDQDCTDDTDGDGHAAPEAGGDDCDDDAADTFTGAPEVWYDGVDQDCAGDDDFDQDHDGSLSDEDCDDTEAIAFPGAREVWYDGIDGDCRGGDDFDRDGDGVPFPTDCDDADAEVRPGAADPWYDGIDQDCARNDDDDQDRDGARSPQDCDDRDPAVAPGLADVWYDGIDADCDGADDFDRDGDGAPIGDDCNDADASLQSGCPGGDADGDGAPGAVDCDDFDPSRFPGAVDAWYDGIDNNCDGADDFDQDQDGIGVPADCDDRDPVWMPEPDADADGVPDRCDTCPADADPAQADADADGWPDACAWFRPGSTLYGETAYTYLGSALALGDVNGDGFSDLLLGDERAGGNRGAASLHLGGPDGPEETPAWRVDGSDWNLGHAVAFLGDVDGDGFGDVAVGDPMATDGEPAEGVVRVFRGSPAGPSLTADWEPQGDEASANFGWSLAAAGDVNGDGYDDLLAGSAGADQQRGRVWVFHGGPTGLEAAPDWVLDGAAPGDHLGDGVAGAGDVNGDGYDDVLVGAYSRGLAWLYLGSSAGLSATPAWSTAYDQTYAWYGEVLGSAGDVNGDGFGDVLVTAYGFGSVPNGGDDGLVYLFLGTPTGLAPTPAWVQVGAWSQLGRAVMALGDVDGDGFDDVAIGGPGEQAFSGTARVYAGTAFGLADAPAWSVSGLPEAMVGSAFAVGDVDGDGRRDLAIGACGDDARYPDAGAVSLFLGR